MRPINSSEWVSLTFAKIFICFVCCRSKTSFNGFCRKRVGGGGAERRVGAEDGVGLFGIYTKNCLLLAWMGRAYYLFPPFVCTLSLRAQSTRQLCTRGHQILSFFICARNAFHYTLVVVMRSLLSSLKYKLDIIKSSLRTFIFITDSLLVLLCITFVICLFVHLS